MIDRLHSSLAGEMLRMGWMVTLRVGVITFNQPPKSVDEMVRLADAAMYSVKTQGKNGVSFLAFPG